MKTVCRLHLHRPDEAIGESERKRRFVVALMEQAAPRGRLALDELNVVDKIGVATMARAAERDAGRQSQSDVGSAIDLGPSHIFAATSACVGRHEFRRQSRDKGIDLAISYPSRIDRPVSSLDTQSVATSSSGSTVVAAGKLASKSDAANEMPLRTELESIENSKSSIVAKVSLPIGEATKWQSVQVVHRSPEEVLQLVDQTLEDVWSKQGSNPSLPQAIQSYCVAPTWTSPDEHPRSLSSPLPERQVSGSLSKAGEASGELFGSCFALGHHLADILDSRRR